MFPATLKLKTCPCSLLFTGDAGLEGAEPGPPKPGSPRLGGEGPEPRIPQSLYWLGSALWLIKAIS